MGTLDESEQSWYSADTSTGGPKIHAEHYRVVAGTKVDASDKAAVVAAWESATKVGEGPKTIYNLEGWQAATPDATGKVTGEVVASSDQGMVVVVDVDVDKELDSFVKSLDGPGMNPKLLAMADQVCTRCSNLKFYHSYTPFLYTIFLYMPL